MDGDLKVCKPGSRVSLGEGLHGIINEINISAGCNVRYHVAWWSGNERKCEWLEAHEITFDYKDNGMQIGFRGEQ